MAQGTGSQASNLDWNLTTLTCDDAGATALFAANVKPKTATTGAELRSMHSRLRSTLPLWRIVDPAPVDELMGYYRAAEAEFGISMISSVSNLVRSSRAIRGVLFPLMKSQRPSAMPLVKESCG